MGDRTLLERVLDIERVLIPDLVKRIEDMEDALASRDAKKKSGEYVREGDKWVRK